MWDWSKKANEWDSFVKTDFIRNDLVIPYLSKWISGHGASLTIADIGCGTGYIASSVLSQCRENIKKFILVDIEPALIEYAKEHYFSCSPLSDGVDFQVADVQKNLTNIREIDLAFCAFTLLEFQLEKIFCENLHTSLSSRGEVVIIYPDVLIDISKIDGALESYIETGHYLVLKSGGKKLTYPFNANRIESIIEAFLVSGFCLVELSRLPIECKGKGNALFAMRFKKN